MTVLAIICICLAAYLWFPLPRQILIDRESGTKTIEPEFQIDELEQKAASSSEILRTLEVIRLCISSGMTISDALEYAKNHSPLSAAQELDRGLNQFRIGYPLTRGLEQIAIENPLWISISDTMIASLNSGSPIANQLADVEFILQSAIDTEKLKRIKSVAVKSVLPLGLCFLPAFILLAVIPLIAGLISGII